MAVRSYSPPPPSWAAIGSMGGSIPAPAPAIMRLGSAPAPGTVQCSAPWVQHWLGRAAPAPAIIIGSIIMGSSIPPPPPAAIMARSMLVPPAGVCPNPSLECHYYYSVIKQESGLNTT